MPAISQQAAPSHLIEREGDTVYIGTSRLFGDDLRNLLIGVLYNDDEAKIPLRLELTFDPKVPAISDYILPNLGLIQTWLSEDPRRSALVSDIPATLKDSIEYTHLGELPSFTILMADPTIQPEPFRITPASRASAHSIGYSIGDLRTPALEGATIAIPAFTIEKTEGELRVTVRAVHGEDNIGAAFFGVQRELKKEGTKPDKLVLDLSAFKHVLSSERSALMSFMACVSPNGEVVVRHNAESSIPDTVQHFPPAIRAKFALEN